VVYSRLCDGGRFAVDKRTSARPTRGRSVRFLLGKMAVTLVTEPPPTVLLAFGLRGRLVRLVGGQGTSWRVGDVVLKPGVDPGYQEWLVSRVVSDFLVDG